MILLAWIVAVFLYFVSVGVVFAAVSTYFERTAEGRWHVRNDWESYQCKGVDCESCGFSAGALSLVWPISAPIVLAGATIYWAGKIAFKVATVGYRLTRSRLQVSR